MSGERGMQGLSSRVAGIGLIVSLVLLVSGLLSAYAGPGAPVPPGGEVQADTMLEPWSVTAPDSIKQGEVLKVLISGVPKGFAGTASMAGRKAWFFRQDDGSALAMVPVSVYQKPGGYTLVVEEAGGEKVERKVEVHDGRYRTQNIQVSSSTKGLQPLPGELETIQALKETVTPVRYWDEPFISPTTDCQNSPFGVKRYHNGKSTGDYHKGVDLRSPAGRPIKAIAGGKVQVAKMYRLHGGTVGLDHGQGVTSVYIHMSKMAVKEGDVVKKGDVIGYVGSTGFATGPHLHWGLFVSGLPVNPNQFVKGVPGC